MVTDAYFYPYEGTAVHDLASVTKSLMTTLIGIAADQGKLRLDQPMVALFGDRAIANRDARKDLITIRHLASMSSGLDCTSERDEATLKEMRASGDWVQFVLDRKVIWEPGTRFVYCSPGMHLLSAILQRATGLTALEFARQNLFGPLGIRDVIWPADNIIVATTGGGFKLDDIAPLLLRAFVDVRKALPANPAGVARLEAAVAAVRQAPQATPVAPLPGTARALSGKTFAFEANPTGLASIRLNFNDSSEATVQLRLAGSPQIRTWPLGLDGVFRMSAGDYDHPQGLRGHWADAKTFVLEYDGITNNDHITFRMRFEANRVVVEAQETAHELGIRFEGRLQTP